MLGKLIQKLKAWKQERHEKKCRYAEYLDETADMDYILERIEMVNKYIYDAHMDNYDGDLEREYPDYYDEV